MNPLLNTLPYKDLLELFYFLFKMIYYKYPYNDHMRNFLESKNLNYIKNYIEEIESEENQSIDNFSDSLCEKYINKMNNIMQEKTTVYYTINKLKGKKLLYELREKVQI